MDVSHPVSAERDLSNVLAVFGMVGPAAPDAVDSFVGGWDEGGPSRADGIEAPAFKSGREFAAFVGLVPQQARTGGRIKLLGISKRGHTYLRTLLIHGARSVLTHAKDPGPWVTKLRQRRPLNVAVVALANKMARTIWAMLAHERTCQKGFVSQPA